MSDEADFIARFHQIVDDLDRHGRRDSEVMLHLGRVVAELVARARVDNWTHLKLVLDNRALADLVHALGKDADGYRAAGRDKAAYVAQLLGISLVAGRLADATLRQRDNRLNTFIDTAASVYTQNLNAQAAAKG